MGRSIDSNRQALSLPFWCLACHLCSRSILLVLKDAPHDTDDPHAMNWNSIYKSIVLKRQTHGWWLDNGNFWENGNTYCPWVSKGGIGNIDGAVQVRFQFSLGNRIVLICSDTHR